MAQLRAGVARSDEDEFQRRPTVLVVRYICNGEWKVRLATLGPWLFRLSSFLSTSSRWLQGLSRRVPLPWLKDSSHPIQVTPSHLLVSIAQYPVFFTDDSVHCAVGAEQERAGHPTVALSRHRRCLVQTKHPPTDLSCLLLVVLFAVLCRCRA